VSVSVLPLDRAVKVVVVQRYGDLAVNVFHYLANVAPSNADLLAFIDQFKTQLWNKVRTIQVVACSTVSITAQLLGGSLSLASRIYNQLGVIPEPGMPTETTYTFRFARTSAGVRGGFKRFTGVSEGVCDFGVFTDSFRNNPDVLALENELTAIITATAVDYQPIIPVTTYNGQPLPVVSYWAPSSAKLNVVAGTQLTRRRGRGS
jgi:hypothetical protein